MRCVLCVSYNPQQLPALLQHLADAYSADMLLSMPPCDDDAPRATSVARCTDSDSNSNQTTGSDTSLCAGSKADEGNTAAPDAAQLIHSSIPHPMTESKFIIGIQPHASLCLAPETTREALHAFCYGKNGPVIGYMSYTYGLLLHGVHSRNATDFPPGILRRYRYIIKGDSRAGELRLLAADSASKTCATTDLHGTACVVTEASDRLEGPSATELITLLQRADLPPVRRHVPFVSDGPLRHSQSKKEYLDGVRATRARIQAGDTYQLNLSIRFDLPLQDTPDTTALFMHLWQKRPAPFYALLHDGPRTIVSTSPERFLQVRDRAVLTQPIKGTLAFDVWNESLVETLTSSPKERAELSMIVDLLRNDISSRCEYDSVRVEDHCSTFTVDRLIQMYTNVRGTLRKGCTPLDLLLDAFPGGSITGCPKLRTMQIIDALEPHSRDLYCGSIFYMDGPEYLDSSIAIRTGWHDAQTRCFSWFAGSGLVIDSVPESEYAETIAKARKFQEALQP
ncbi:chorismate-binding protein [Oleidesulfovibrio sp.]|uniref:chorismate-binding protein n=1 Tax=Oleidesulfovibrio sp. TaxID=2909707 RepID=UPI003A8B7D93